MYEVLDKDTKNLKFCRICLWQNVGMSQKVTWWKSSNAFSTS